MIEIQKITEISYAESLSHILIAAWRSGFRGILNESTIEKYTNFPDVKAMFSHILASGTGTMYLAQLDGNPAGLLYLVRNDVEAQVEALLTIPDVWGKGVAARLMTQALCDAEDADCSAISVWPFAENHRARQFYEKNGFHPTGQKRTGDALELEYSRSLK